ncbi:autotransporter domain-containing protein [Novispirillum sp. DQ9]|uniref:autotransporter outer membrane beta-barrel domain-containing protein n=1 Tax=Novispirillum sp. DQ9 TaxID=3398612 RepID=UPI003C7BDF3A
MLTAAVPLALVAMNGAAAANIISNGDFEAVTLDPESDAVDFGGWTSTDPSSVRAGTGFGGTGNSAEFLFSTAPFSQTVTTAAGEKYQVTFQYKSDGGQGLTAYFGNTRIFNYVGDDAPPTGWETYTFTVQAFDSQSTLRFDADSQGAAQNIDNVSVVACPTCDANPETNLGAVIDTTRPVFTTEDEAGVGTDLSGTRTLTFDGGTLQPAAPGDLGEPEAPVTLALQVASTGGTIDTDDSFGLAGSILNTAGQDTPFVIDGTGQGTVSSDITNNGALNIRSTGNVTLSGTITNTGGTITVDDGGTATVSGTVSGGDIIVQNGSMYLNGAVNSNVTVRPSGVLRGNGAIVSPTTVNGTLRPGNSPGTLTFAGSVTQATGSTLTLDIDGPGTGNGAGNYSRVIVTGPGNTYTIQNGATLTPVLRGITYAPGEVAGTNSFTPALGQRFAGVVQAAGGVVGTFTTVTQPDGLADGTRFVALYNQNSMDLYVTAASFGGLAGLTVNRAAAGAAVDALEAGGTRAAQRLVTALAPLDTAGLSAALGSISGEGHANLPLAAMDIGRGFGNIVANRQGGLNGGTEGWQVWARGFGSSARTTDDGNNPGFNHRLAGGMAGIDYGLAPTLRVGVALGQADSSVTGRQGSGEADIESQYVGTYLGWTGGALFANAQFGVTASKYETERTVAVGALGGTATGETDGRGLGGGIQAGYRMDLNGFGFEPSIFARYDGSKADAFAERGAGLLNLAVAEKRHEELRAGLGARVTHSHALSDGAVLQPELSARWEHEMLNPSHATQHSLAGQTFQVQAAEAGQDSLFLGGGLTAVLTNNLRLMARYDAEVSANRTSHAVNGQIGFTW